MKTTKKDNKKKARAEATVLVGSTGKKKVNILSALAIKLALTYLFTFGILMNFTRVYAIPYTFGTAAEQTVLFGTAFFAVLTLIKKRYALPVLALIGANIYFFCQKPINDAVELLRDHMLIQLDSRLLSTLGYVPADSHAFLTQTQDYISDKNIAMFIISALVALIVTLCCVKRMRVGALTVFIALLYVPGIIAEKADYNPYLLLLIAGLIGMYAISAAERTAEPDRKKPVKKSKRQKSDAPEESRAPSAIIRAYEGTSGSIGSYITGLIAGVLALAVAFGSQSLFPGSSFLDLKDAVDYTVRAFHDLGECFSNIVSGDSGSIFSGYFSDDNFFINNRIELNSPPSSGREQILHVYSDTEQPIYLIGDIGVNFQGDSWESIQRIADTNEYIAKDGYDVSDSFSSEMMIQLYRFAVSAGNDTYTLSPYDETAYKEDHYNSVDSRSLSSRLTNNNYLRVEYLKNTNIVFKPYMPANGKYLREQDFNYYGDSVIRIADKKDWMQIFESNFVIPVSGSLMNIAADVVPSDEELKQTMTELNYSPEEAERYIRDKSEYTRYVYDMYMSIPDSELDNIRTLNENFAEQYGTRMSDYAYAYALSEYLRNNYEYSLTEDNSSNAENTILGRFLNETKKGHCALYASAMTLALREHGIPARYITGFAVGQGEYNTDSGMYESYVLENNLHAWVEAYFPNLGWLMFDPTGSTWTDPSEQTDPGEQTEPPATTTVETTAAQTTEVVQVTTYDTAATTPEIETTVATTEQTEPDASQSVGGIIGQGGRLDPLLIGIVLAIVIAIALIIAVHMFFKHIDNKEKRRRQRFAKRPTNDAVKEMHEFIMKLFGVTDLAPRQGELPMEFALRTDELMKISNMSGNLYQIMLIIEKAEFSLGEITEDERAAVLKYTDMLYRLVMNSCGRIKKTYLKIKL